MLTPRKGEDRARVCTSGASAPGAVHPCARSAFRGDGGPAEGSTAVAACGGLASPRRLASILLVVAFATLALGLGVASAQTPPGTEIDNVGSAVYRNGLGTPIPIASNLDRITVVVRRTPSTIEFLKYGQGAPGAQTTPIGVQQCSGSGDANGPFAPAPPVTDFSGSPIDLTGPVPLVADGAYHAGEPVFVRVEDADQNLDSTVAETVDILLTTDGGDRETLRVAETGPDTGVFVGAIMSATPPPVHGDCRISVAVGESMRADYVDAVDGSDASSDTTLVDPFGVVFDSATGAAIDGAEITLWDVLAGTPASPIGDDGLASFPATIVSGGTATDSAGRVYDFAPGRFRFPFVMPGQYELRVVPPPDYRHPSVVSDGQLQSLPGAPFALVPGSRGETFVVPVGPAVQVDIPLDPTGGDLLVTKQAGKDRVGAGEFVPYRLRVTNSAPVPLVGARLFDRLPPRFRFEADSARIVGGAAVAPRITRGGTELVFDLGDVPANGSIEIAYVARVGPGTKPGEHVNRAFVEATGGLRSNVAEAVVRVEPDLFDERSYLLGRVHVDACGLEPDESSEGLAGVKVYLEDGSFVVTDAEGRYHFEAIAPGTHVVQLDLESIPEDYELEDCLPSQRRAGRSFSEFVELRPGTLWRSDFYVRPRVPESGLLSQELTARIELDESGAAVDYALALRADRVAASDVVAMVRLPEALVYEAGSARLGDEPVQASAESGTLVVRLDRLEPDRSRMLHFRATTRAAASGSEVPRHDPATLVETTSIVRARPTTGKAVTTPPATLRFPLAVAPSASPSTESTAAASPGSLRNEPSSSTATEATKVVAEPQASALRQEGADAALAVAPDAPSPSVPPLPLAAGEKKILKHRLLHRPEAGVERYALQIYVEDRLPDVILAEVELPPGQQMVAWSPRNELGVPITTLRTGRTTRFILPRHESRRAVRVFLLNGQPQRVLQVFFTARSQGTSEARALSRVLPAVIDSPATRGSRVRPELGDVPSVVPERAERGSLRGAAPQAGSPRDAAAPVTNPPAAIDGASVADVPAGERERGARSFPSFPPAPASQPPRARASTTKAELEATTRAGSEVALTPSAGADASPVAPVADPDPVREPQAAVEERFGVDWLADAEPGRGFVYPAEGALPRIPSLKLGIQHEPGVVVELLRNGALVSPVHLDGRLQNADRTIVLSRWRGIGLREGENHFVAIFRDEDGAELSRVERRVHLAGAPARAVLVPEASTLVADGRTAPIVALRLFDRFGEPVREGSTGQFDLDPPYQTEEEVEAARTQPLAELGFERPSFVVEEDGLVRIRLHPTSVVGDARLRFQFREDREDELRVWLEPGDRDWVLVGLATGTVGWRDAQEEEFGRRSRRSEDVETGVHTEGRVAFFAKGRVPGKFLLTAAYDSDANNQRLRDRLFQTLEPDEHYTLYGDTTQRDFDAPTSGPLYVKIERKRFYALYGDYQTGLEETELSRYARSLTGAKLEYRGDHFEANGFVTDTDQSFVRDEILGDGTSGLYRLSREDIVPGSESITIETRDRFRPERVVEAEPQSRFADYDIDYRDGTLFFRRPIPGQDENFDPIFIVVDYETNDRRGNAVTGGGRVAGRAAEGRVELGFTGIHESGDQIDFQLYGGDLTVELADATELRAEFAHTRGDDFDGRRADEAWLVELDHRGEKLDLRAYAKEQGEEFGVGQQRGTAASLRSYGVDAGLDWTSTLRSETSVFRQENLSTDAERNVAELRSRWDRGAFGLNGGVRYSNDDNEAGSGHGVQALLGGRSDLFDGRVSLRAEGEAAITEDQYGDFPYRALVGGDWHLHERLALFVDQEMTFGDEQRTADTRAGFRGAPWKGASVTTSINQEGREYGPRTYANLGLQQRWDPFDDWGFDLSIDRTATIRDPGNPAFNPSAPAASGSFTDDYTAVSLGSAYRGDAGWSGTGRLEARFGEKEDRWGFVAGLLRDANEDLSYSARVDFFYADARSGTEELRSDTSLSLAYRPLRSYWIVLERLDFEYRDNQSGDFDFESRKLLNHFKANQLWDRRTQVAWQLSNKLVVDTIDERRYTNFGTLAGVEMRRDFAPGWDMSVHGRVRHQTSGDEVSLGYGLSVGRILVDNVWLSLGYNLIGFYDDDFSSADYTAQGPYFRIRAKFDQLSVKQALQLFR